MDWFFQERVLTMIVTMIIKVVMMICDNGYKGAHDDCDNADY